MRDQPTVQTTRPTGFEIVRRCRVELAKIEARKALLEEEMNRWSWVRWDDATNRARARKSKNGSQKQP
jgi:hypothetical protein